MFVYKICATAEWLDAKASGRFEGSAVDRRDGYVHLSTREQLAETLARHFAGRDDLVALELDDRDLGDALRYEPSRGGALFPHCHGPLPSVAVRRVIPVRVVEGVHVLDDQGADIT